MPPNSASVRSAIALADSGSETSTRHGERGAAVGVICLGDLLGALGVDVGDHHRRALAGQRLGVRLADAAAGSGDDGHLVLELISVQCSPVPLCLIRCCGNGFGFQVLLETGHAHLAADAGLLVAAERHVGRVPDAAVDVDRAGADPRRPRPPPARGRRRTPCPTGRMASRWRCAPRRRRRRGRSPSAPGRRSPRGRPGRRCQAGDHGRLDEEAGVPVGRTASAAGERAALLDRRVEVALRPGRAAAPKSADRRWFPGRSDRRASSARHGAGRRLDRLVVAGARHHQPGGDGAALPGVHATP